VLFTRAHTQPRIQANQGKMDFDFAEDSIDNKRFFRNVDLARKELQG
jgi:hypothetical protein